MNKTISIEKTILFILLSTILMLSGCVETSILIKSEPDKKEPVYHEKEGPPPWAPAHGYRAKHKYRYYPSSRVYFDEGRGLYFYYRNSQWGVSVSLPSEVRISVNDFVTLEMDSERPYEYDSEVVKRYPPGQAKKKDKNKAKGKWK